MNTLKIKTSELTGAALDWAVGVSMSQVMRQHKGLEIPAWFDSDNRLVYLPASAFSPSTKWEHGGPLLAELMATAEYAITPYCDGSCAISNKDNEGFAYKPEKWHGHFEVTGDSLLIATCRAVVTRKLGGEIEVPAELVQGGAA